MPHAADPHQPSSFGRGWIPASRDIGLPGESRPNASFPLPQAGGVRGGHSPVGEHEGRGHSRVGEGAFTFGEEEGRAHPQPLPLAGGGIEGSPSSLLHPNQFTPTRIALFLDHLSRQGQVRAAAQVAGVSSQTAYVRRRREPAFAAAWDAALLHAREAAEQVLATRALHGTTETIWFRGEAVGERRRFDARLLLAHLARLDARAAAAPKAIHHLAEDFDRMLLALAEGADVAAATGFADPAQDRFLKACEKQAEQDFQRACPYPLGDESDEAWDDWQDAHDTHMAEARQIAREAWDSAQARREVTLRALFGAEEEQEDRPATPVTPAQAGAHDACVASATNEMDPGLRRDDAESPGQPQPATVAPAQAGAHDACVASATTEMAPGLRRDDGKRGGEATPEPCKPRKPLPALRCGTSATALLSAGLNWPLNQSPPAPRQLPATPVPLPPALAQPWLAAATGRPW